MRRDEQALLPYTASLRPKFLEMLDYLGCSMFHETIKSCGGLMMAKMDGMMSNSSVKQESQLKSQTIIVSRI